VVVGWTDPEGSRSHLGVIRIGAPNILESSGLLSRSFELNDLPVFSFGALIHFTVPRSRLLH
jgi:hypothetical protein